MANGGPADRESQWGKQFGQVMGTFFKDTVEGDGLAKDAAAVRAEKVLNSPNIKFKAGVSIPGIEDDLVSAMSVPRIVVQDVKPIIVKQATLEMSMNVSDSQETSQDIKANAGFEGEGKIGWGPISVGIKIHGSTSVASHKQRKQDYRSTVDIKAILEQADEPEGLMLIIDAMNKTVVKGLDMAERIIEAKAQLMLNSINDKVASGSLDSPDVNKDEDQPQDDNSSESPDADQ